MDTTNGAAQTGKSRLGRWFLVLLLFLLAMAWIERPDGRMHIYALNTPGDALLVQSPTGRFVLIDGGSDPTLLATTLGRILPFWRRDLAAVVLTQADSAHLPGQVAALARYRPAIALAPPGMPTGGVAGEWRRLTASLGVPLRALRPGMALDLGGGAQLRVLGVAEGAVLLIEYGATRVLLHAGGPDGDTAAMLAAGPVTALAYPWQRELDTPLLAQLRPRALFFTSAYLPDDEPVLLSYAERRRFSPALYHEELDGSIELISDGRRAWVETEE